MSKNENKKEVFQPDDKFFKKVMEDKVNAQAYLENFYPELASKLDMSTLVSEDKESFLTEEFKLFKSDIIYRCQFKESKEQVCLTLLWENKSQPEKRVAIQLGLYIFLAMHKMVKTKGEKLIPILPLLFYNGKKPWKPLTIQGLFSDHSYYDFITPFLPNFSFLFKDINKTPIAELIKIETAFLRSSMIAMANKYNADLFFKKYSFIFELEEYPLSILFTYICGIMKKRPEQLRDDLVKMEFKNKNKLMSTLEMLLEEGREEGREEEKLQRLRTIFKLFSQLENLPTHNIADISNVPLSFATNIKNAYLKKDEKRLLKIIRDDFFQGFNLSQASCTNIENMITDFIK